MKLIVEKKEVWIQSVAIEAESTEDALTMIAKGEGEILEDQFQYSHMLGVETWNVYNDPR